MVVLLAGFVVSTVCVCVRVCVCVWCQSVWADMRCGVLLGTSTHLFHFVARCLCQNVD